MKYLYIQENKDWHHENKFKYGYTENPKNRIISEQHSYKSSYVALYECQETDKYLYDYKEYDKIISSLRLKSINDISQEEIDFNIDLKYFKEIKEYLIYNDGGTEFIYSNEGIELLDNIFLNIFKEIGLIVRKLTKQEIDIINNEIILTTTATTTQIKEITTSKIKLRDYQINIIKQGIEELEKYNKFYLELATGAGKSTIIYYILNNIIIKNYKNDVYFTIIIFTPRINICLQNIYNKYIDIFKIPKTKLNVYDNKKIRRIRSFDKNSFNIISCCLQSYQFIYDKIIMNFDINNIIIWFDEAHYSIENWISNIHNYKLFYLKDNERIKYRLFTSASPNKEIIKKYSDIFGNLYYPMSVRLLIKERWLTEIRPHIMNFDDISYPDDIDISNLNDGNENSNKYYYYINTILNTFQKLDKTIGLNFHNSCVNASFAFKCHYNKFINSKTYIKPYLLISNEEIKIKVLEDLNDDYKYLMDFNHFHNENKNAIAYIVNMYSMGYDNSKIDFLSFGDPKLSNKDIIQSIGRGIRSDGLDIDGKNKNKINDVIIPIYDNSDDNYIRFNKIKEILQYLIYDIEIDIKNIKIYNYKKSKIRFKLIEDTQIEENKIIANIVKWDIEPTAQKWNLKNLTNHLLNNNIHNYNLYLDYVDNNKELNLPLDLFKKFENFDFNTTYKSSPYYSKNECIKMIEIYINDFDENEEIDMNDNNEIIEYLNKIDPKIPKYLLWQYYGGNKEEYLIFV